jgi:hypothetical protein
MHGWLVGSTVAENNRIVHPINHRTIFVTLTVSVAIYGLRFDFNVNDAVFVPDAITFYNLAYFPVETYHLLPAAEMKELHRFSQNKIIM